MTLIVKPLYSKFQFKFQQLPTMSEMQSDGRYEMTFLIIWANYWLL